MTQLPVIRESDDPVRHNSVPTNQNSSEDMESRSHVGDEAVDRRRLSDTPDTSQTVQQNETSANAQRSINAESNCLSANPCQPSCSRKVRHNNEIGPAFSFQLDEDSKFLRRSNLDCFDFKPVPTIDEPESSQPEPKSAENVADQYLKICPSIENNADGDGEFLSLTEFLQNNKQEYRLLERIDEECPYMRYAKDTSSNRKVIIIFYRFRVSAEHLAPYRKMEMCNCVPKLLSIIRPEEGLSFLVFQCGEYTLHHWMKVKRNKTPERKREVLSKILSAISNFHWEEIVHGNLSLSTVMWFPDGSWKLLFPMLARRDGNVHHLVNSCWHPRGTRPYMAPEIFNPISRGEAVDCIDLSCDMWLFGTIACELFQDTSYACSLGTASAGGVGDYRSSRRIYRRIGNVQSEQAKELVKSLTSQFPDKRLKYKEAMEDAFFKPLHNPDSYLKVHKKWTVILKSVMQQQRQHMEMTRKHHAESRASDICADVSMEYFRRCCNPKHPFHLRKGRKVFNIRDSWLLQKSVPLLKIRENYRLRVTLTHRQGSPVEALKITGIEVSVRDENAQSLAIEPVATDPLKREVCAHLELDKIESEKLKTVGPCFGKLEDKYVPLNVLIKFTLDGDGPVQQISQEIWCRMVSPRCNMVLPRLLRAVSKGWRCLPNEVQCGALMLFIAAKFAVGL